MEDSVDCYELLLRQGADRLKGYERRLFMAEVTLKLCDGNPRKAERRFGWGRETVSKGIPKRQLFKTACRHDLEPSGCGKLLFSCNLSTTRGSFVNERCVIRDKGTWPTVLPNRHVAVQTMSYTRW